MLIAGLEKCTLLDYPGQISAIVFTYGCNMSCPYCHNPELVTGPISNLHVYRDDEVLSFLKSRVGKLDGVVITGGEPTLHADLVDFIHAVKELGFKVKLDTNGSNPEKIAKILADGSVDYWAIDVKGSTKLYAKKLGLKVAAETVIESMQLVKESAQNYEFRSTIMKGMHSEKEIRAIGEIVKGGQIHYIQNFRPGKTIDSSLDRSNSFTSSELMDVKRVLEEYVTETIIRNE